MKNESLEQYLKRGGAIKKIERTVEYNYKHRNQIRRANFKTKEAYFEFIKKIQVKVKK